MLCCDVFDMVSCVCVYTPVYCMGGGGVAEQVDLVDDEELLELVEMEGMCIGEGARDFYLSLSFSPFLSRWRRCLCL